MKKFGFSPKRSSSSFIAHYPSPSRFALPAPTRSLSDSVMVQTLGLAEPVIVKWDPESSTYAKVTSLFYENRTEAFEFIKIVNKLHKAMHSLAAENSNSELLIRAQHLMQIAMKRLEKEFYQILSLNRAQLDPESVSTRSSRTSPRSSLSLTELFDESDDEVRVAGELITEVENAAEGVMKDLKTIADCMISSGYGLECVNIYKVIRKSIVDEGIYKLGIQKLKPTHVHKMDFEVLDVKIQSWLDALKIVVKTLFHGERVLCDQVFASSDSIREACYTDITKEGALILFGFPEIVAKNSKKAPERIFRMLDMYTAIADRWPDIVFLFSFQSTSVVVNQAVNALVKLGETVRLDLTEYEALLNKESLKTTVAGAGVHKVTFDTMNYLSLLGNYGVLADILLDNPPPEKVQMPETFIDRSFTEDSPAPALSLWLTWFIFVLVCKLDAKAKHYKDVSQAYLFLANNLQHIISTVRSSNLRYLLGDDWINKRKSEVQKFAANYERVAWGQVIDSVPKNMSAMTMTAENARDCFKKINTLFDETHRKQLVVEIPNSKLRDEIKVSVARKLLPAYTEFYNAWRVEMGKNRKYAGVVKYAPEDIGNALSDLFFGSGSASASMSSSLSESRTSLSR
ncbi:putative exocyst complex component Exo70, cullin repeat-like-containing domain superfamily [Helianthus annuus]|uniref:Exocyst subunit Exo70 family protein n=1 Tax=Helianthus annuus TaxID=4232 RepID=A0A251SKW6_HELAN|nr:exocyst complex component EXO70H1 [Helianthus annuus]KAF5770320.1 putative exocyst complex component Exo70, cullin repeat-like-containing domain superfamily [Helianthus annuus]KAJ0465251.1 putative exocyst complex component Exo70, cullin repeat-like-containing domain superfamily [Helianthus annuus]KAJ0486843.1 putative exocyst complex component Exo70, cullin repeat-like-containing domain superfamily [Helianthus annuus]KAJ0660976.1 putative exocyst complex component Exo70, cullin repeat-like-